MNVQQKTCLVVLRMHDHRSEVLAFRHPSAGNQFIKGTIEDGEEPQQAAIRELREESGLIPQSPLTFLGSSPIGPRRQSWYFFGYVSSGLPDHWQHMTENDHGHIFDFFWHPLGQALDENWDLIFHEAHAFFRDWIAKADLVIE